MFEEPMEYRALISFQIRTLVFDLAFYNSNLSCLQNYLF